MQTFQFVLHLLEISFFASVERGRFRNEIKMGIVRPKHKSDNKMDYDNYRPVTPLLTLHKVIEKFICKQVINFITIIKFSVINNTDPKDVKQHIADFFFY